MAQDKDKLFEKIYFMWKGEGEKRNHSKHVRAVFKDGELQKDSVWAKFAYTASDGKTYQVDYYNLDVIISVGYRVKSVQGTQLRVWASFALTVNTPIKFISKRTFLKLPAIRQQLLSDPTFVFGRQGCCAILYICSRNLDKKVELWKQQLQIAM